MKKAFVPGKWQPPHIGHVRTISKLMKRYWVILAMTDGGPRVMSKEEVFEEFKDIFDDRISYVFIEGVLVEYTSKENLPKFDILCSGNSEVLEWGERMGYVVEEVPRSKGICCSGTELRSLYGRR